MTLYTCDCGCGETHLDNQMVRHGQEVLYIPHAIEVFGLFKTPIEIHQHLYNIHDYDYVLPGSIFWDTFESYQSETCLKQNFPAWQRYPSKYGNYYVRKLDGRQLQIERRRQGDLCSSA